MTNLLEVHPPDIQEPLVHAAEPPKAIPLPFDQPALFSTVLLEADGPEKRRRKWSAVWSISVQCLVIGLALMIPLMFTDALPKKQLLTFLIAPPPPPPPPPPAAAPVQVIRQVASDLMDGRLRTPTRIPQKVEMLREDVAPPPLASGEGVVGGVPGGIPGGQLSGVIGGIISSASNAPSVPKLAPPPKRVRVSQGVIAGMLLQKVEPLYPALARQARIQGDVVLNAMISRQGTIENLKVASGHPMLIPAALEAVRQWRYRPFLISGDPVEVDAVITVTFRLSQ